MSMSDPHDYKARDLQFVAANPTVSESVGDPETTSSASDDVEQTTNLSENEESRSIDLTEGDEVWAPPKPQLILKIRKMKK